MVRFTICGAVVVVLALLAAGCTVASYRHGDSHAWAVSVLQTRALELDATTTGTLRLRYSSGPDANTAAAITKAAIEAAK